MKKSELKKFQIVELRNGERYYVCDEVLINNSGHLMLSSYNKKLLMKYRGHAEFDIMIVYELAYSNPRAIYHIDDIRGNHIIEWSRENEIKN